jgi:hypothetical protein
MRKRTFAVLAVAIGIAVACGLGVTGPVHAYYNQTSCAAGSTTITVPPLVVTITNPVVTIPGSGSIYLNGGNNEVACADGFAGTTGGLFDGGAVSAGAQLTNGPDRACAGDLTNPTTILLSKTPGAYVVVDGDQANMNQLGGYVGASNYESGTANEDCKQGNNGSGTNSGGAVGVDGVANAPVPLVACGGGTSSPNFGSTGRDGCYVP